MGDAVKKEKRYCSYCSSEQEFQVLTGTEHAVLWESSHAVLRESSHAVLRESSHAELRESSHAVLSKFACAHIYGKQVNCKGGVQIRIPEILTAKEWCAFYGVEIKKGIAILYKAVNEDFSTQNGIVYTPGTLPEAPDWDDGKAECGGGLHFSFHPGAALEFKNDAEKFVACPVKVSQIVVHKNPQYPNKIKARRVCAPVWECDRDGKPIIKDG